MWGICMPAGLGCTTNATSSSKRVDSIPQAEYNLSENVQASSNSSYGSSIYPTSIRMISKPTSHVIRFPILVFLREKSSTLELICEEPDLMITAVTQP